MKESKKPQFLYKPDLASPRRRSLRLGVGRFSLANSKPKISSLWLASTKVASP